MLTGVSILLTVYYRGEKGALKSFQIGLAEQPFDELTDFGEQILKPNHIIREAELAELVGMFADYRQRNPLSFKDFRAQAVVTFKMRKLALAVLRGIEADKNIGQSYKDYFYYIAQYSNMMRYFLAQSATLDTFKSSFLPVSDKLNFKIFGLSVDKIYRVVTFVERAYSRARSNIKKILPEFYNCLRVLGDIEENLKEVRLSEDEYGQIPGEKGDPKKYPPGTLEAEFDAFSMSIEIPYANSIMGLELMKRHGKVLKSLRDILVLVSPLILWLIFGLSLVMWIPWAIGVFVFIVTHWLAPKFCDLWSKKEYQNFAQMLTVFAPKQILEKFVLTSVSKNKLLEHISRRFFPKVGWGSSHFILGATHFSDVQAVRENSYAEIRFATDSQFMVRNSRKEQVLVPLRKAIFDGTLGFRALLNRVWEDVPIKRTSVYVHPTGIRVRIDRLDTAAESLEINYNDPAGDLRGRHTLDITNDVFKQLISQWDHFMENAQKGDWNNLDALIVSIQKFCSPDNINVSDFRKNAGFYHSIRDRALATYEVLVFDNATHGPIYRQYFLELARYAVEVRFLSATFAGMDVLKSWYLPDGEFFNREILGFPLARILRAIFGVSFLYSWARADTLKSISRLVAQWNVLVQIQGKVSYPTSLDGNSRLLVEKKLKTQFEKSDFAFRYPAKNSLVGSDRYNRNTPQLLGLSLANFSIVFYLIAYWINPIHGNNALEREHSMYSKIIDSYENQLSYRQLKVLQAQRVLGDIWSQVFYYLSYVLGIFSPTVVMGYFLYQQIQSKFWKNGNQNGNSNRYYLADVNDQSQNALALSRSADVKVESSLVPENPGGMDLGLYNNVETHGQSGKTIMNFGLDPENLFRSIEGMDFQILELTPILNPSVFLPKFVKGAAAQELLSLK